uniref:Uncharacterized protein n=1 Tax=Panagrolaimus superbus TaxID=310955 RepID=A0A914YMY0_9BILA
MAFYVYPRYSNSDIAHQHPHQQHLRHHHRHGYSPYSGYTLSSPAQVQDALDLVSALVDGLSTSDVRVPRSRFTLNENGQFKFAFDIHDYKPEELKVSF